MATQIFVNLPVKNLDSSVKFFTRLGFSFNPQFTDENATCMIVEENIFVMLLTEAKFKDFIVGDIEKIGSSLSSVDPISLGRRATTVSASVSSRVPHFLQ